MKVIMNNNTRYKGKSYCKGSEVEVDKETAERWIKIGIASEIEKQSKGDTPNEGGIEKPTQSKEKIKEGE